MEKGVENPYSCMVLAGARSMDQRRDALQVYNLPWLVHQFWPVDFCQGQLAQCSKEDSCPVPKCSLVS
jgi:hypothetical protein